MATKTLGTIATTTLTAIQYRGQVVAGVQETRADYAAIAALILDDQSQTLGQPANAAAAAKPIWPGAFNPQINKLYIPNRGSLLVLPGDWIGVDANGWPILLSRNSVAGGTAPSATTSWAHS